MQTRSSSKFIGEPSTNPTSTNPKRRNRRRSKQRVEPFALEETPVVTMADQRTMAKLLHAPTEGYAEAIVVPPIPAEHFELKHSLIRRAFGSNLDKRFSTFVGRHTLESLPFFFLKSLKKSSFLKFFNFNTSSLEERRAVSA
ncbi:hypothetical protein Tco_1220087 [Tanacetum coccineum]